MTEREKLMELLEKGRDLIGFSGVSSAAMARLADDLLMGGVAVPVQCKNCKSRNHDGEGKPWCDVHMMPIKDLEFFCRDGKPKTHNK